MQLHEIILDHTILYCILEGYTGLSEIIREHAGLYHSSRRTTEHNADYFTP